MTDMVRSNKDEVVKDEREPGMLTLSKQTEALARRIAEEKGADIDDVVRLALETFAGERTGTGNKTRRQPEEIVAGIERIARRATTRPIRDARPVDEIIGYDESGIPR